MVTAMPSHRPPGLLNPLVNEIRRVSATSVDSQFPVHPHAARGGPRRVARAARLFMLAFALACAGCSSPMVQDTAKPARDATRSGSGPQSQRANAPSATPKASKGEQELERAVKSYEEGAHKSAARQFQAALDFGLDSKADRVTAHKYLAFIVCVSGREKSCRDEFRKALAADPSFELGPAEIGHPVWGPVFRSVKSDPGVQAKTK
jgi:hypothetical protein